MVNKSPNLPQEQVYPEVSGSINLNTCGDPDCGNFGVAPDFTLPTFHGRGAAERRLQAAASIPALTTGLGIYTMSSAGDDLNRVSSILDYFEKPTAWNDGRVLVCEHQRGKSTCSVKFHLLSNQHFEEEAERLRSQNGVLTGTACGACGQAYI